VDPAFLAALCDDLNTPAAIARAHEMASHIHKTTNPQEKEQLQKTLRACGALLGLLQEEESTWFQSLPEGLSVENIEEKIHTRTAAKANKDYALADQIRRDLERLGILLEDTPQGTTWRCQP
jgi:cysteinyl-tRNA synthetase